MATIKEQAAAIRGYAAEIDAAIVAKGGTTQGGLRNAAAAIEAIPSGGEEFYPDWQGDDGNTHIWISAEAGMQQQIRLDSIGGVTRVDWGDGESTDMAGIDADATHIYRDGGLYRIDLISVGGSYYNGPNGSQNIFGDTYTYNPCGYKSSSVVAIEIGNNFWSHGSGVACRYSSNRLFDGIVNCKYLKWHSSRQTGYATNFFSKMFGLRELTFPYSLSGTIVVPSNVLFNINGRLITPGCSTISGLSGCSCDELELAEGVETINANAVHGFARCKRVFLPSTLATIGSVGLCRFSNEIEVMVFGSTTPPNVSSSYTLESTFAPNGVIYVPYSDDHSILNAYKTTTNLTTYARYMRELNPDGTIPTEA